MKITLLALAIIGLMARGYFMYQAQQAQTAKQVLSTRGTVDQIRHNMQQGPDTEADAAARGKTVAPSKPTAAPATVGNNPADATQRREIESSLKALHVTTIMPGQPGLMVIDKKEFYEGQELPLDKGRKAKIVAIRDDGVQLTCNGMAFYLDESDLAAMRKKK